MQLQSINSCLPAGKITYFLQDMELEQTFRRQMGRRLERTHRRKSERRYYKNQRGENGSNHRLLRWWRWRPGLEKIFWRNCQGNQDAGLGSDPEAGKTPSAQNKGRTGHYGAEFYGESGRPAETVPLALHPERPRRKGFRNRRPRYHIHLSAFHLRRCQIPQKNIMEHDGHRLRNRRAGYGGA